ncbi:hypothetical protein F66182_4508 [Fusarium sp. NRRL 66182]|nr:hypothetical protein F66182_4508 [Fusarium sp. NRRL 66182]
MRKPQSWRYAKNQHSSAKRWLVEHQIGIADRDVVGLCLALLTPLIIAQCTPITRSSATKFTFLSYYDPVTEEYGVGSDDNYLVITLIVVLCGLRDATMRFILALVATACGLSKGKSVRFKEQAWMVIYYLTSWSVGMSIYITSPYWFDLEEIWTGWPNRELSGLMKKYMLAQLAFWLQQIIVIHIEKRRRDHWQMLSHHVITIALIYGSYRYGLTRIGHVVLILMDFNDLIFSGAKCLKYLRLQTLCDTMFGVFVVSWILNRHVAFPMVCWSLYTHSLSITGSNCYFGSGKNVVGPVSVPRNDGYYYLVEPLVYDSGRVCFNYTIRTLFLGGLLFLEGLMMVWFVMIVKLIVRVVRGENAQDTRSDAEEDEHDITLPIKLEIGAEKLDLVPQPSVA